MMTWDAYSDIQDVLGDVAQSRRGVKALAETGLAKLRAELVQAAATAVKLIEAIDRRPS